METNKIVVTGCGDCILCGATSDYYYCEHPDAKFSKGNEHADLFATCPLKAAPNNSILITLKTETE